MIHTGKCPYCQKVVARVKVEDVDICVGFQSKWRGFSYQCTSCGSLLSVEMNPLTLNEDLRDDILDQLGGKGR